MFELIQNVVQNLLFFFLHLGGSNSFPKALSASEEKELLAKMKDEKDSKARDKLIEHNLRLVAHIIKKYYATNVEQEDLISIGTIGLIKGIDSFNPTKGARLATYAARCIENEILMTFRLQKKNAGVISINEPIEFDGEGNPLTLIDVICTEDTISDDIDLKKKTEKLYQLIDSMENERDREIIIRRYGLYNTNNFTQREIANGLDISRSYVSRLEKKVIKDLYDEFKE